MMDFINRAYVSLQTRVHNFKESFRNDERGVGAMVATIIIMLIVVLLAAVFWEQLSTWFSAMMGKIFNPADNGQGWDKPTVG